MKKQILFSAAILVLLFILNAGKSANAQQSPAAKWLKSKAWRNGVKLKLHPSVNAGAFYEQYQANKAVWDKAFQLITQHNLDTLKPGKYPIDGDNAYANITEAQSKELEKASWESHQNYIDLQYVINGKERIGVAPVTRATVTNAYDAAKDVTNYMADGQYYVAEPGTFFLFFPKDAHRPNIKVEGFEIVKKMVIKIKVVHKVSL